MLAKGIAVLYLKRDDFEWQLLHVLSCHDAFVVAVFAVGAESASVASVRQLVAAVISWQHDL